MSQLAFFTFLPKKKAAFLGLWSMPERRLFRKTICRFEERLTENLLHESVYDGDGIFIALVFAILEKHNLYSTLNEDPVAKTLRIRLEISCWILSWLDQEIATNLEEEWGEDVIIELSNHYISGKASEVGLTDLNHARNYIRMRLLDLKESEVLLIRIS